MAAYAALVSVMQIVDQIHDHPHPPISIHKKQSESLTANVTSLQEFLQDYNPHVSYSEEADPLESRIAKAAYAAEDVIESYIVDQIYARTIIDHAEEINSIDFSQGLQKVIEEMDLINMEIKEKKLKEKMMGSQYSIKKSTINAGLSRSSTAQKVTTMVGFDDVLYEMLDKVTGGGVHREIIPIVGMGGLGKTTLARNIFANPLIQEHFDIRAWSTISQVHNAKKILSEILGQVDGDNGGDLNEYELGEKLYKCLIGRKYFIVMDDIWSLEAWDRIRNFFPNCENGSKIVVTTRLSNLASQLSYSNGLEMKFLDEASSWKLFSKTVFGDEIFPTELEDIGKKIVEGCRGLPLSIVVAGGLLSKSELTRENWEVTAGNLSSSVNLKDEGSCLQILYTSYNNLPVHIKPCFLYLGIYDEDDDIQVGELIQLWVAEGIIKPVAGKSLEEVSEDCIEELVDRNLLLVERRNHYGKIKSCKMHDLLRDLSLKEAEKDNFLYVLQGRSIDRGLISTQRRISAMSNLDDEEYPWNKLVESAQAASSSQLVRSWFGLFPKTLSISSMRLLRVGLVDLVDFEIEGNYKCYKYYEEIFIRLVNLRFLMDIHTLPRFPSSVTCLWNLQTLWLGSSYSEIYTLEIWKMPQLRLLKIIDGKCCLPDPPPLGSDGDDTDEVVLKNLHTLSIVMNLKLGEKVLKRIPNIKVLKLFYVYDDEEDSEEDYSEEEEEEEEEEGEDSEEEDSDEEDSEEEEGEVSEEEEEEEENEEEKEEKEEEDYCLNNLHSLPELQVLSLNIDYPSYTLQLIGEVSLPYSLKKLTLQSTKLPWEDMSTKIGCLPLLQVLKLEDDAFVGSEWKTDEGQFSSLKFLSIDDCGELEHWITDNTHFPRLEHLVLIDLTNLSEIPSSIGDIPTLRSIKLRRCNEAAVDSARQILKEQEEIDNLDIQLHIS